MCVVFWFDVSEIAYVCYTGVCCSQHLSTIYLFMHSYALQIFWREFGIFGGETSPPPDVPRINPARYA